MRYSFHIEGHPQGVRRSFADLGCITITVLWVYYLLHDFHEFICGDD